MDAFLDFACTEISAQPSFWRLKSEQQYGTDSFVFPRQMHLPPRLVLTSDGDQIKSRHRLLRGISQTDLASQKKVNQRFPKFPHKVLGFDQDCIDYPGFAHVCPSVDIFKHENDHEPTYTRMARLRSLSQPTPANSELLRAIEHIQFHGWCGRDSDLSSYLSALPNIRTVNFTWQPPPDGPFKAGLNFHAHNNPPAVPETHPEEIEITEWWKVLRRCSSAWEKGVRLFYSYHEACVWPGYWPSYELLFDPTLTGLPFRIRKFVDGCEDCLDALPRYSVRERSVRRSQPSRLGLIPVVDDATPSVTLDDVLTAICRMPR